MEENEGEGETGGASRGTESVPAPPPSCATGSTGQAQGFVHP